MSDASNEGGSNLLYIVGLLSGGLLLGFGVTMLYTSFGMPGITLNGAFEIIGFTAIDNIALLPAADFSIGMVVGGVLILAALNSMAWKYTGGY